jgi:CTP:molybdopterin cytidylyltransferase MocA
LEHALRAQCAVDALTRVVVVLGAEADQVLAGIEFGRAEPVVCSDWGSGQAASLRCGLQRLRHASKVIVTLGDQPLISAAAVALMADQPPGARASYEGRPGHPVVLGSSELRAVQSLHGDEGARSLLDGPMVECSSLCSDRDVDIPEDLEAIRDEVRAVL